MYFGDPLPLTDLQSNRTSRSDDTKTLEVLENKVAAAVVQIDTSLSKVNTRLQQILAKEPESEEELQIINRNRESEEQQQASLAQCLVLCQAAANGVTQMTGHSFTNNKVSGDAKVTYGNVGQVHGNGNGHKYDRNEASGEAIAVYGNMDGNSFATFMGRGT